VNSVAYSPSGDRIVSSSYDTTIRVWDARTGMPIWKLYDRATHSPYSIVNFPQITSGSKLPRFWLNMATGDMLDDIGRGNHLIWVPEEYRKTLWWPTMHLLIGHKSVKIDFRNARFGTSWVECRADREEAGRAQD